MKSVPLFLTAFSLALAPAWSQDEDPNTAKLAALENSAKSFIDAFNKGDAKAIAGLFLPDGEIVLSSGELIAGRDEITAHYSDVLAGDERAQAALEAGSVRFVTPGVATEDGTVHLTATSGEVSSFLYHAVHVQQEDGRWLFASVRDQPGDKALPSEKLLSLEWMIGDWLVQIDGTETWITFDWSEDGPYIDARALTETAGAPDTSATMRIGWNARSQSFTSWGFDALGGFTFSEWTQTDHDSYLLRSRGVTADGEVNSCIRELALDPSRQQFKWTKRDQVIGGELQPDRTLTVVKRPPEAKATAAE